MEVLMRSNLAIAVGCVAVIVLCVTGFSLLYRDVHPLGSLQLSVDSDSAGRKAASIVHEVFPELSLPKREAQLSKDDALIRGAIEKLGQKRWILAMRNDIPGYFWATRWKRTDSGRIEVVAGDEEKPGPGGPRGRETEEIEVRLSTGGNLVNFEWSVHDTASVPVAASEATRALAEQFLQRHFSYVDGWSYKGEKRTERAHRIDVEYAWEGSVSSIGQPGDLKIKATGSVIIAAGISYPSLSDPPATGDNKVYGIVMVFLAIGLGTLMIVIAFKRSRAYEMSFRQGTILGVLMALLLAIEIYMNMQNDAGWQMLISLVLGPLFFGGAFVLVWSIAESVAREAWREKLTSLDLLINGHVLHSRVGRSLLQGLSIGAGACLVWALLVISVRTLVPALYVPADGDTVRELGGLGGPFILAAQSLTNNAYVFAALLLFLVSLLRLRSRSAALLMIAGALAIGLTNRGGTVPVAAGVGIGTLVALVLSWGFYKFDALASLASFVTMNLLMVVPAFFTVGTESCVQSGYLLATGMMGVAILGVVGMLTRDSTVDLESITPAFVKHITERERLQRELEIARDVQMSFLPRRDPEIPGVDIASRCVPALEVGGDYYDFVNLGSDRFGVVVGDVSGKGTEAAFYMTLTKGFLKAVTRASESPARVLIHLNELFYENVERGTFISMVYGIFDLRKRTVTIARAGHNPPLRGRSGKKEMEFIHPAGLALGLESGPAFAGTIKEFTSELLPGDLFVFYTDGFTEAMNRGNEEYGEGRLLRSVETHAAGTAAEVMNGIFADIKAHAGKSKQHDDMTIVVVKTQAAPQVGTPPRPPEQG
jgi:phosphoserine phosphatase RsbU/P